MATNSDSTSKWLNFFVCIAAAIVIIGALFKLQHWKGADIALILGLSVEALIFLVYAFVPDSSSSNVSENSVSSESRGTPALASMDKMLTEVNITPDSLQRLSDNFEKLGYTVDNMRDLTDVVAATSEYTRRTREATTAIESVSKAYTETAQALESFNKASDSTRSFHEQLQSMTKNLSSLNAIYELELQDTNNYMKAMNSFYGNLTNIMHAMDETYQEAKQIKDEIPLLAKNLNQLNAVYGNMLSAMQYIPR